MRKKRWRHTPALNGHGRLTAMQSDPSAALRASRNERIASASGDLLSLHLTSDKPWPRSNAHSSRRVNPNDAALQPSVPRRRALHIVTQVSRNAVSCRGSPCICIDSDQNLACRVSLGVGGCCQPQTRPNTSPPTRQYTIYHPALRAPSPRTFFTAAIRPIQHSKPSPRLHR